MSVQRNGQNGVVVTPIETLSMPPSELVYEAPKQQIHIRSNNHVRLDQTFNHNGQAGATAHLMWQTSPGMLLQRRLEARYRVEVMPNDTAGLSIVGSMTPGEAGSYVNEARRAQSLYGLWPDAMQRILTSKSVKLNGRAIYDDVASRYWVNRVAESNPNITQCPSFSGKNCGPEYQAVQFLDTTDNYAPDIIPGHQNFWCDAIKMEDVGEVGTTKVYFECIEHFSGPVFLTEHQATHHPDLHGISTVEIDMTFGNPLKDMVRIKQLGYKSDGSFVDTILGFSIRISPVTFSLTQTNPLGQLLAQPRISQWFTTPITSRTFPIPAGLIKQQPAGLQLLAPMLRPTMITVDIPEMTYTVCPKYIILVVEYQGGDPNNKHLTSFGRGSSAFVAQLSIGVDGLRNQMVNLGQSDLQRITEENGGFKMPYSRCQLGNGIHPLYDKYFPDVVLPTLCQPIVLDITKDVNTPSLLTGGLFTETLVNMQVHIAKYKSRIEPADHDNRLQLRVIAVNPGYLLENSFAVQTGTTSAVDLAGMMTQAAKDPTILSSHVETLAYPPARSGFWACHGGNWSTWWNGAWGKTKKFFGNVWQGVKRGATNLVNEAIKDPLGTFEKVSGIVGKGVEMLGAGEPAKRKRIE